jgi:UDP-N-acetyl-D-mannosaminuronic acid dehydrogenase
MHIVVIGMGYVGIPCAALLADVPEFRVTGVQRRSARSGWKIDALNQGRCPFEGHEPGLATLLQRVVLHKRTFHVTDDLSVCREADAILLDVQTPVDGNRVPQYESLREVAAGVGRYLRPGTLVVIESTVAPGTTQHVVQPLLEQESGLQAGQDFSLAFAYERVMPGKLLEYQITMPRVVGGIDPESTRRAVQLYANVVQAEIHATDCLTAELSKTVENTYRDVNIAFANEMALVCESLGVDVFEVRRLVNSRSDRHMHLPGAGVGGHCLPKDPWLLNHGALTYGCTHVTSSLLAVARQINDSMPLHMADLVQEALTATTVGANPVFAPTPAQPLAGARIAVLGVAYLEDSDDTRNTPAAPLIRALCARGATVVVHDPYVRLADFEALGLNRGDRGEGSESKHEHKEDIGLKHRVRGVEEGEGVSVPSVSNPSSLSASSAYLASRHPFGEAAISAVNSNVHFTQDLQEALTGADCAALVTRHSQYLKPELLAATQAMRTRILVDGRGCLARQACERAGITVWGLGRKHLSES